MGVELWWLGAYWQNYGVAYAASDNNVSASEGIITLGTVKTHTLVGLQPLTTYNITVVAVNDVGPSNPSTITLVETKPTSECMHEGLIMIKQLHIIISTVIIDYYIMWLK